MTQRWSAHIGYLYTELPLAERLQAAATDGFTAVEHPSPYAIPAAEMRQRLKELSLTFSQVTSGMGDPDRGEKGLAALPGREAEFRQGFDRALEYALAVGCPFVHPMAGVPVHLDAAATETYEANISYALAAVSGTPISLLIEPITIPGYAMGSLDDAMALQDRHGPRIKLLLDTYHAAVQGIDATSWFCSNHRRVGHIHIADHPGRHEPGTGLIDFDGFLAALRMHDYAGAVGFEYVPTKSTSDSARFLAKWASSMSNDRRI
ncbi:hydroxypyruvate isomerase [Aureimonas altamirensis DSM 21988]|uniref:Hydroxypyruvate isomerase n=2 Tax=Aureimonas altamirensis TaxID=370622 RepID=A0A0P0YVJ9_9HYPH|nr:TIM barrel protein [Aureimonas altamirensis]BAT25467.1 hydroxypyruvate isomerase [Aureimonas altamirensis]SHK01805.1 hydroxypyruvate isomerase [Aureimonas altamirensis DSM 21988]